MKMASGFTGRGAKPHLSLEQRQFLLHHAKQTFSFGQIQWLFPLTQAVIFKAGAVHITIILQETLDMLILHINQIFHHNFSFIWKSTSDNATKIIFLLSFFCSPS